MRSRTVQRLIRVWAIFSVLWIVAVAWGTYENLPAAEMPAPATPAVPHELNRWEAIKVGAAFAFVPPALILIGGVSVIRKLR
jgi:hypothetical protein